MQVLFIDTVHPILWEKLAAAGLFCVDGTGKDRFSVLQDIHEYHGVVIRSKFSIDEEFLSAATNLKFIARSGSGLENINLTLAKEKGIKVFNSPEGNRDAVAEHAMGMLLSLFNHLIRGNEEVNHGLWRREENRGLELKGKTIGLIGFGNMGRALAQRLVGFDCEILSYDKYHPDFNHASVKEVGLKEIQKRADVISFHVPYNQETHYYFDEYFLDRCEKPFFLINTSRGKVVQTEAVVKGIKSGKLLGACLDVLEFESSSFEQVDSKVKEYLSFFKQAENVILSPHVAGWTVESYEKLSSVLAQKILNHLQ